jgi:hypothetical protein
MISRFTAKVLANSLSAGIALGVLAILFASFRGDQIFYTGTLDQEWRDNYWKLARDQAKKALKERARTGEDDALVALLETSRWSNIQLGDRAYPLKRKLLEKLCMNLMQQGDYRALAHWASQWLSLNERNLNARALWYEAIRHLPGQEREGLEGLINSQRKFPANILGSTFLVDAYRETNSTDAAKSLIRSIAKVLAKAIATNWEIFWITQDQKHFSQAQSRRLAVNADDDGKFSLVVNLPAEVTKLRVDPPSRSALRIYDIELTVNQRKKRIQISDLNHKQIVQDNESLIVQQSEDPKFFLPIEVRHDVVGEKAITVKLEFQINLIVHGDELPLAEFL